MGKLLCSKCYQELDAREYDGLGVYVEPCECSEVRERAVAAASALIAVECAENFFSEEIEEVLEELLLDGKDSKEDLEPLEDLLTKIVRVEANCAASIDIEFIYDEIDV